MRKFFFENLGIKLFALVLAGLLEFYFYSPDNSVTETHLARVFITNLPESLMVVKPANGRKGLVARVRLTGPNHLVNQLRVTNPSFSISLPSDFDGRSYKLSLSPDDLNLPNGVEVKAIEPPEIELGFEKVIRKSLKVNVPVQGKPKDGMKLSSVVAIPSAVVVRGPNSELKDITEVSTGPVDISGISRELDREMRLEEVGRLTELGVNVVSVRVDLEPLVRKRAFASLPIKVLTAEGFQASVKPLEASIVVTGPSKDLEKLEKVEIGLVADASPFSQGQGIVELQAKLPSGFSMVAASPAEVKVNIWKTGEK